GRPAPRRAVLAPSCGGTPRRAARSRARPPRLTGWPAARLSAPGSLPSAPVWPRSYPYRVATAAKTVEQTCREAKDASHLLARPTRDEKDACLRDLADRIDAAVGPLLEANRADVEAGREQGLNEALLDRLALTEARIAEMAKGVREIADLEDPVGEVVEGWTLENGLEVAKKRVPIGVVAVVYEARPNVTIDAAALCL